MTIDLCEVLEDRPNTFTELKSDIQAGGFTTRVTKSAPNFSRRIEKPSLNVCSWLIDNHIDNCLSLKDFKLPQVTTNGGSEAGYKIIVEVIIPRMQQNLLPWRPIGLMSANDIARTEALFRNRYDGPVYGDVYFIEKPKREAPPSGALLGYMAAMGHVAGFDKAPAQGDVNAVHTKMLSSAAANLGLSRKDLEKILLLNSRIDLRSQMESGAVDLDSSSWTEMAAILFKIDVALGSVFQDNSDPLAEEQLWIDQPQSVLRGEIPRKLLLSGSFDAAYQVLDAASFFMEGRPRDAR